MRKVYAVAVGMWDGFGILETRGIVASTLLETGHSSDIHRDELRELNDGRIGLERDFTPTEIRSVRRAVGAHRIDFNDQAAAEGFFRTVQKKVRTAFYAKNKGFGNQEAMTPLMIMLERPAP